MAIDPQKISLSLIPHEVDGDTIFQRASDGYVNGTALCKKVGKLIGHYQENTSTKAFLAQLSSDIGIPISGLVETIKGGVPALQGTWVHPKVAINLAQWCSPEFAVAVVNWVFDWMSGAIQPQLPYHLRRYLINNSKIPHTHFSILTEMTLGLIAPMESAGYTLPESLIPDISQGRMFSQWLRDTMHIEPKDFPSYDHKYEDGRIVSARLYPNELLPAFRKHFNETWIPERSIKYFSDRDPKALPYIDALLLLRKPKEDGEE